MIMQASFSLALREIVRFLRQKNRVIGALATPVIFWFLLGSGVGRSLASSGIRERADYLTYFFPGIVLLIILFTAIFSTVSVIGIGERDFCREYWWPPMGGPRFFSAN